jgi:hypothetical protein
MRLVYYFYTNYFLYANYSTYFIVYFLYIDFMLNLFPYLFFYLISELTLNDNLHNYKLWSKYMYLYLLKMYFCI